MKKVFLVSCVVIIIFILINIIIFKGKSNRNLLTVVVPHHNLVKEERLEFWDNVIEESHIKANKVEKIIIIGPDHFGDIKTNVTYDDTDWTTYSTEFQNFFERPQYFPKKYVLNNKILKQDHAIAYLITEIHNNFPNAKFVPFIIGEEIKFEELDHLIKYTNDTCNKNCILVISVDFSHEVTLDVMNKQDERTIDLLKNKNIKENSFNQNNTIEADSPASLYVMQEFARRNELNWKLFNHTNSAFGNTETIDTVSHIFGAFIN